MSRTCIARKHAKIFTIQQTNEKKLFRRRPTSSETTSHTNDSGSPIMQRIAVEKNIEIDEINALIGLNNQLGKTLESREVKMRRARIE